MVNGNKPHGPVGPVPILGGPTREQRARAAILEAVNQLSLGIYSQLAVAHIATRDEHQAVDAEHLHQLARYARTAAQAFFEGLGVAQFSKAE